MPLFHVTLTSICIGLLPDRVVVTIKFENFGSGVGADGILAVVIEEKGILRIVSIFAWVIFDAKVVFSTSVVLNIPELRAFIK